jgi:response regulator NasT
MPIMDGLAAAERVANGRIAPVVILTAFSQRDLVERARAAGAMAYLVKPFQKSDLVPAIEIALSRYAELHALETEVASLADRLETRKLVERAKGTLMAAFGMTEPEAFKWIQRAAMDNRMTMKDVASKIIAENLPEAKKTPGPGAST